MKKQSRTVPRRRQSVSPTPRHLPLVDILIDTQAELQELVVASGLKVLEAMLEEDRAAVCRPRYAQREHPGACVDRAGEDVHEVFEGSARRTGCSPESRADRRARPGRPRRRCSWGGSGPTGRPRRQRAVAGHRCWRRSLPSCCERGRSPPRWHTGQIDLARHHDRQKNPDPTTPVAVRIPRPGASNQDAQPVEDAVASIHSVLL